MKHDHTFNIKQLLSVKCEYKTEFFINQTSESFYAIKIIKNVNVNSFERLKDQ